MKKLVLLKRTALTKAVAVVLALLFSTIGGAVLINAVAANPAPLFAFPNEPVTTLPKIVVHSPIQNQRYNSTNVLLNFTIVKPKSWFAIDVASHADHSPLSETFVNISSVYFTVDGGERQNIPVHDIDSLFDTEPIFNLNVSTMLPLTAGTHTVKICLEADSYYVSTYVYDFSEPLPSIKLETESYTVHFTVPESSKPDADNSTTTESSEADANDSAVTELSEQNAINFTITDTSVDAGNFTTAEPFPTALIVTAFAATVAILGAGLLTYFKKRKR